MTSTERVERRRVRRQRTFVVRHDSGETFEVHGLTLARIRKLIDAERQDRGWLWEDFDWFEVKNDIR